MGIAAGVPKEDLEIMFRWASNSEMYRHYRSVNMEESPLGAPAMVARALVQSMQGGPTGTSARIVKSELKSEEVDGGWYDRTIQAIHNDFKNPSGISGVRAIKLETPDAAAGQELALTSPGPSGSEPNSSHHLIKDEFDYLMGNDL